MVSQRAANPSVARRAGSIPVVSALVALVIAACGLQSADPYFTDVHECRIGGQNSVSLIVDPIIDGFYTIEVWQLGVIPTIDEVGAIEVLGNDPDTLHFVAPYVPVRIMWKARGGDDWQVASRKVESMPTNVCLRA